MGRTVWVTDHRHTHVHADEHCLGLRTRPGCSPVQTLLAQVRHPVPCRRCFPDAPRLRVWHYACSTCGHSRPTPCPHNGAVLALVPRKGQWSGAFGTSSFDPELITYNKRWVWPENAFRYTLAHPGQ